MDASGNLPTSGHTRAFVESWVNEYVHLTNYEGVNHHSESRTNALACYESALIEGITKEEIAEQFQCFAAYIIRRRE